jgi:hypothetical protein
MAKDPKETAQGQQGDIGNQARDRPQQQGEVRPDQDVDQPGHVREQPQQPQAGPPQGYGDIGTDIGRDVQEAPRAGRQQDFDPSRDTKGSGGGCG